VPRAQFAASLFEFVAGRLARPIRFLRFFQFALRADAGEA